MTALRDVVAADMTPLRSLLYCMHVEQRIAAAVLKQQHLCTVQCAALGVAARR
jgi:hypothetical protein